MLIRVCSKKLRKLFWFLRQLHLNLFPIMKRILFITVNVLANTHKILAMTKRDIFQLNFTKSDQTIGYNGCRKDSAVFATV